jgi:hypothetical protein
LNACYQVEPFAGQRRAGKGRAIGSGGEFFGYHALAVGVGRSAANGYPGQAHRDHALGFKSKVPNIVPKSPIGGHLFHRSSPTIYHLARGDREQ